MINRFYIVMIIMFGCGIFTLICNNTTINLIVIVFGFFIYMCCWEYILNDMNEKEERFIEKIKNLF